MIKWTKEMEKQLMEATNISKFARENGMSAKTASNKKKELLSPVEIQAETKEEVEVVEIEKEVLEVESTNSFVEIPSIISNIDDLIRMGVVKYAEMISNKISRQDSKSSDLLHLIELKHDILTDENKITIVDDLHVIHKNRRTYKDELEFLKTRQYSINGFLDFLRVIKEYDDKLIQRKYKTRILKEVIGTKIITDDRQPVNNSLVEETLEEKQIFNRMKKEIQNIRANMRLKGNKPAIDILKGNWRELFFKESRELINECLELAQSHNIFSIEDSMNERTVEYVLYNHALPEVLANKNMYIKGGF